MTGRRLAQWITPEALERVEAWTRSGLGMARVAARMGLRPGTLVRWRRREAALDEALARGEAAYWQVEAAMFRLATGYKEPVRKHYKLHRVTYNDAGRKVSDEEELVPVTEEVFVSPSVTAGVYWLNHRKPEDWDGALTPEALLPQAAQALLDKVDAAAPRPPEQINLLEEYPEACPEEKT